MKLSNTWFAMILIASASLLGAASNGVADSPNQRSQTPATTQNSNTASTPVPVSEGKIDENTPANSGSKNSSGIPWREIGEIASVLSTAAMALFTFALWRTSKSQWRALEEQADILKQQLALTLAQFDQWIDLTNWRCPEKTHELKIWVDLVNPTGFPIEFTGYVAVANNKQPFENLVLSPNSPKSINFDVSIADDEYGPIDRRVTAHFSHLHKITKAPVPDPWVGVLKCEWWGHEHKWHVTFTRFAADTER